MRLLIERVVVTGDHSPSNMPSRCPAVLPGYVYSIDVLACAQCGGRLRFVATIEDPPIVSKILAHLGLPTRDPSLRLRGRRLSPTASTSPDAVTPVAAEVPPSAPRRAGRPAS